jgi:hypothetical protein
MEFRLGAVLFWAAASGGLLWLSVVLFRGWRQEAGIAVLAAAGMTGLCGLSNALLGGAHLVVVLARALSGQGFGGKDSFTYDFHFYSIVMVGILLILPGLHCLHHAHGLVRGRAAAWRGAFWASLVLLCVNLPMVPFQGFAGLLTPLAAASLVGLSLARRRFTSRAPAGAPERAQTAP